MVKTFIQRKHGKIKVITLANLSNILSNIYYDMMEMNILNI